MASARVVVNISCDRMGVCCARKGRGRGKTRNKSEVCGMDYKFPWEDFNVSKRDRGELNKGWPVRKLVGRDTWFELVDAASDGGLFGVRKKH